MRRRMAARLWLNPQEGGTGAVDVEVGYWVPGGSGTALGDLRAVLALAKKYSGTLGFLRNRAFTDRARHHKGLVLGRVDGMVAGYTLFDLPRNGAIKLVHVCVNESARGSRLGERMIRFIVNQHPNQTELTADCRQDYRMDRFWISLGMAPLGERPGRKLGGSTLVRWRKRLGQPDLFETALEMSPLPLAVLDTNITMDLHGLPSVVRPQRAESAGLTEPGLSEVVNFAISRQVDVEIHRIRDADQRAAVRAGLQETNRLRTTRPDDQRLEDDLRERIGAEAIAQDSSLDDDLLHVADAVRARAAYFVTNDEELLRVTSPWLEREYGLKAVRPSQLTGALHEGLHLPAFVPRLIESDQLRWVQPSEFDERVLELAFTDYDSGERGRHFRRALREQRVNPDRVTVRVLVSEKRQAWALVAFSSDDENRALGVHLLRVLRGERSLTLALQLARFLRTTAAELGLTKVTVNDQTVTRAVREALDLDGFELTEYEPRATVVSGAATVDELRALVPGLPADVLLYTTSRELERQYWPLALLGAGEPCSVIPIRPGFATKLLGYTDGGLMDLRPVPLGLSRELVYFQSASAPAPPDGSSRVLWYVTADETIEVRKIAARSRIIEAEVLPWKDAFDKYRKLGALARKDVQAAADKQGNVRVIRFEETELLKHALDRREMEPIMEAHGIRGNIMSLRRVPSGLFDDVMRIQRNGNGA
jgi:hypothetical protein